MSEESFKTKIQELKKQITATAERFEIGEENGQHMSYRMEKLFNMLGQSEESRIDWLLDLFKQDGLTALEKVSNILRLARAADILFIEKVLEWFEEQESQ